MKNMFSIVKRSAPTFVKNWVRKYRKKRRRASIKALPPLSKDAFRSIIVDQLNLKPGDCAFIHSAFGSLNVGFDPQSLLEILMDAVGSQGTLVFPTYPKLGSLEFLRSGEVFDIRESRSFTGILTELARCHPDAVRSLHPTKSVVAIGRRAIELTSGHQNSHFPYDRKSPYFKIMHYEGKVIGFGVWTYRLSFVHTVDDALRPDFSVCPYHKTLFYAPCIDYRGNECFVASYAHDLEKIRYDTGRVPVYMKRYIPVDVCRDVIIEGRRFFCGNAQPLYEKMINQARNNITLYLKASKKTRREEEHEKWIHLD